MFKLQGPALTWAITFCSTSAFFLIGYDQGVLGSIISTPNFLSTLHIDANDANTISNIVSLYDIGNIGGCILAILFGGRLGRKNMVYIGCSILIAGAVIQTASYSVAQLIVGRIVAGVGNGINTATIPTWVAETSQASQRGRLIATQLSMTALGATLAYFINYGFYHISGEIAWRFPIGFQIVFALATLVCLPFLPESPRFLYARGRLAEADEVMAALKGEDVNSEAVQYERATILAAIAEEDLAGEYSLKTVFFDKSGQQIPRRMALVVVIQVIQELSGTNIIVNYASNILINIGLSHDLSLLLGGVVTLAFWLGSLAGIYLIEKVGRKMLLYSGTIPMFISYIIYTLMVKDGRTEELWVAFAFLALIIASFGWSWLSVAWVLGPELVPVRYRHVGGALNALSNWTFVFVTVKIGPIGLANLGWRFYIIFIIFTALQFPIVYFFIPETKGLSLEEIDLLFMKCPDHEQNAGKLDEEEVKELENVITVTQVTRVTS
ncbi:hypothetical protein FHL15_007709 [Xylaria flabelliformis]|uniref:Major facilitator superfamily (MFS) profile domain-containing protein n=1 Tax=Xylaria flabelliformis TaxID=2512241 RepID=A0A553HU54_9PEZI|nr:hypothetical protein FHL15_007709 [Xylaria flabelliformis]